MGQLCDVTQELLEQYRLDVGEQDTTLESKVRRLAEVRRLWTFRSVLPENMRLPQLPPWGGADTHELFGRSRTPRENLTPRIHEDTMGPLLVWALRFVENFSTDILTAYAEYLRLHRNSPELQRRHGPIPRPQPGDLERKAKEWITTLHATGGALPGKREAAGTIRIDWRHVGKVLNTTGNPIMARQPMGRLLLACGLPVADAAYLGTPITGMLGDKPWRERPFDAYEIKRLSRLLRSACFVVVSYLSGARPGEVLNLQRGCITRDEANDLWLMSGRYFKGAVDEHGNKLPAGAFRHDPWVVVKPVADAVAVLERLHDHWLLFPTRIESHQREKSTTRRKGEARTAKSMATDLAAFVAWVNSHAAAMGADPIPVDDRGPLNASRFRRTLAWFIRRRPRGLVAGAIQYGHVHTRLIQGYANPRELHQAGEKPQVTSSWRRPDALEAYYQPAA